MKSVALQMARATRVADALGATAGAMLFSVALLSQTNFRRILGIVIGRWRPIGATAAVTDKHRAVGLLTPPEEETWACVVSA
jgi:hypothetical protein